MWWGPDCWCGCDETPPPLLLTTGFRLAVWCLLTADLSRLNLMIGLVVALLLPRAHSRPLPLRALLRALGRSLLAVPQAYVEALRLIFGHESVEAEISESATEGTIPCWCSWTCSASPSPPSRSCSAWRTAAAGTASMP